MKKDAIILPVNFDDGTTRQVAVYADNTDGLHYSLMIDLESAGSIQFSDDKNNWTYSGELSANEQQQIAGFIQQFTDQDWHS